MLLIVGTCAMFVLHDMMEDNSSCISANFLPCYLPDWRFYIASLLVSSCTSHILWHQSYLMKAHPKLEYAFQVSKDCRYVILLILLFWLALLYVKALGISVTSSTWLSTYEKIPQVWIIGLIIFYCCLAVTISLSPGASQIHAMYDTVKLGVRMDCKSTSSMEGQEQCIYIIHF